MTVSRKELGSLLDSVVVDIKYHGAVAVLIRCGASKNEYQTHDKNQTSLTVTRDNFKTFTESLSQMAPKQPPVILPPGCTPASLLPIQHLLHLTAHRNKNQHRIAKWWASFSILRRQLGKLITALENLDAVFRAKKIEIEKRVIFLKDEVVPRCYLAFSTVVADNQYASLGLMLMGCLARLNNLISFPKDEEEEVDEVIKVEKTASSHVLQVEDFGEAISREELEGPVKKAAKSLKTPKKGKKSPDELLEGEPPSSLGRGGLSVSAASTKVITETVDLESDDPMSPAPQSTPVEKKRKKPEQQASQSDIHPKMLPDAPCHAVQVLWRKHRPDEQVRPQPGARRHDEHQSRRCKYGLQSNVVLQHALLARCPETQKHYRRSGCPEDRPGPVAHESEYADGDDVVPADAVVGAGEVDGGDGVGAAEGEEGHILKQEGGDGDLDEVEVQVM
ncbi:hypothetical protein V493_08586 [Pseudogymnoascus sp. VKM F-4281 (FW-2241)]|nr:hypothetical protein V493_08586 [Pseudogymnoascus sp. VKM F-4281 (FW-2241)]